MRLSSNEVLKSIGQRIHKYGSDRCLDALATVEKSSRIFSRVRMR